MINIICTYYKEENMNCFKNVTKKCLCFLFVLAFVLIGVIAQQGTIHAALKAPTGHPEFKTFDISEDSGVRLINELSEKEIKEKQNKLKRRFFGWRSNAFVQNYEVTYVGETIFSRANSTHSSAEFTYSVVEKKSETTSISVMGSISPKISGKVESVSLALDSTIRGEIGKKKEFSRQDKTVFTITINPGKKISLIEKGTASLSNGAAKYFIFGFCVKRGMWEYIDVVNQFYELCEEYI